MLPPTSTSVPAAASIRPTSVVVVDFPFVPVIAITGPFSQRHASSSSPIVSTPARRASSNTGCSNATPGLVTIRSAPASVAGRCPPSSSSTPASRNRGASSNDARVSVSITRAPLLASSFAAAMPLRAAPTTTTRRPSTVKSSTPSPPLQRRQTEQRKDDRQDEKTRDDLRLAPANQLEVMVDRRHLEDALAGQLEGCDLDDDRPRLHHEDAADDDEQQFLLDEDGDRAKRAAEGERADVTHEDFGGIRVVPEETEARADERAAEDRELARRRKAHQVQVLGELRVAGDISQRRERRSGDTERADGKPVQSIGEVYGVRPGDEDECRERQIQEPEIRNEVLEEREDQARAVERGRLL